MRRFLPLFLSWVLPLSIPPLAAETASEPAPPGKLPLVLPAASVSQGPSFVLASLKAEDSETQPLVLPATGATEKEAETSVFEGRKILAFYGRPGSKSMGILGEYPKEELASLLFAYARLYDDANGGAGVIPAFYLIYGTCWPEGEIGYLRDSVVEEWIDYAAKVGIMVILDNQIGRFGVDEAMARLLPWLGRPNVHLALDPEWRTTEPMRTIGSVSAEEINMAQALMADWLAARGLGGERVLVVHQFSAKMISGRERVRSDFPGIRLIHSSDGFGSPLLKRRTYAYNALADNMPRKGFKLFMKTSVRGAGWDDPLLTPAEVLSLRPSPELIIYQ